MSSFTTPLVVSPMPDGRRWKLVFSFIYHVGSHYSNNIISVPVGFVTDFASIPWLFWNFLPAWGKYGKAAVIHDYLYQTGSRSRKESDTIFLEAMLAGGTKPWKAKVMYWAVKLFGKFAYKNRSAFGLSKKYIIGTDLVSK